MSAEGSIAAALEPDISPGEKTEREKRTKHSVPESQGVVATTIAARFPPERTIV